MWWLILRAASKFPTAYVMISRLMFYNIFLESRRKTNVSGYFAFFWQTCLHVTINTWGHAPTPCLPPPGTLDTQDISPESTTTTLISECRAHTFTVKLLPRVERGKDAMLYNFILKYLVLNYECTFPFSQTAWGKSIGIENVSWPD